jgi:hypothetical protein
MERRFDESACGRYKNAAKASKPALASWLAGFFVPADRYLKPEERECISNKKGIKS